MAGLTSGSKPEETGVGYGAKGSSRTILWCVPRSISTALTKCLSHVEDIQVWLEPYYYCEMATISALVRADVRLPAEYRGNEEMYQTMAHFFDKQLNCKTKPECLSMPVIQRALEATTARHVFVKDIAEAMSADHYKYLPQGYKHTFLIRHPRRVFSSYRKAIFPQLKALGILREEDLDPEKFDVGRDSPFVFHESPCFGRIYDAWKYVRENLDPDPIVIDGDDLASKPAEVLPKYCRAVGLPYNESLLKWDTSDDVVKKWKFPADGLIGQLHLVYGTAMGSSEFMPPRAMPSRDDVTPDVNRCTDQMLKNYEEMYEARIKV